MADHHDRHAVMIAFVVIGLLRGTPAHQHRTGRLHLAVHLSGRPGQAAGLPVRGGEPLMQPHETVAARVARSVVRTRDIPVE